MACFMRFGGSHGQLDCCNNERLQGCDSAIRIAIYSKSFALSSRGIMTLGLESDFTCVWFRVIRRAGAL